MESPKLDEINTLPFWLYVSWNSLEEQRNSNDVSRLYRVTDTIYTEAIYMFPVTVWMNQSSSVRRQRNRSRPVSLITIEPPEETTEPRKYLQLLFCWYLCGDSLLLTSASPHVWVPYWGTSHQAGDRSLSNSVVGAQNGGGFLTTTLQLREQHPIFNTK